MTPFLAETVVSRPLCRPIIHDDATRLVVTLTLLPILVYAIYRTMRYFDGG